MPSDPAAAQSLAANALRAAAQAAAAALVKRRARAFAHHPESLDALAPGLAAAPSDALIAFGRHHLGIESRHAQRWFGFGGEVRALNAKAVLLLGRTLRRRTRAKAGSAWHRPEAGPASCAPPDQ